MRANIRGGEGFDWYYPAAGATGNEASSERIAQTRLPITDGAYGKAWIYKPKAIKEWWQNHHYDRPGGVESGSPTAWMPESKPIWFTEVGCPAVDKGSNQPNVFIDPKSAESFAPYFSRSVRDDLIQRRYLTAIYTFFDPSHEDYVAGSNPVSGSYGSFMVDLDHVFAYTWDARPYPAFPFALSVWADGGNWEKGHWLTGRVAGGPLAAVVAKIMEDYGFTAFTVAGLHGFLDGYCVDRIMSARAALQPLELAYFFDSYESAGIIKFAHRGELGSLATLNPDDLVAGDGDQELFTLTRAQETELPSSAKITFIDGDQAYAQGAVESRRLVTRSGRVASAGLPIVLSPGVARGIAETWLHEAWMARESAAFSLPPSRLALEPTDVVTLEVDGRDFVLRLISMTEGLAKSVEAKTVDAGVFLPTRTPSRSRPLPLPSVYGTPNAVFLDLPLLRADAAPHVGYVAATSEPWPGAIAFYRSPTTTGFRLNTIAAARAALGVTLTDFYSGPLYRYDRSNALWVELDYGELASVTEEALLNGANYAAVQNADQEWEVLQFMTAELVAPRQYKLSDFLRGQFGTGGAMRDFVAAGARFVMLDSAVTAVDMTPDEIGLLLNWKYGPAVADLSDPSYVTAAHAFVGLGLRPLSPVHLQGKREPSNGDWTFLWVRRTRAGGDSWEGLDVPLGEDAERYRLEILVSPGGAVKRTVDLTGPTFLYTAAMQTADFGSAQWNVSIRVAQISPSYGPGVPAEQLTYDYQH